MSHDIYSVVGALFTVLVSVSVFALTVHHIYQKVKYNYYDALRSEIVDLAAEIPVVFEEGTSIPTGMVVDMLLKLESRRHFDVKWLAGEYEYHWNLNRQHGKAPSSTPPPPPPASGHKSGIYFENGF